MTFLSIKAVTVLAVCVMLSGCLKSSEERAAEHLENGQELVSQGDLPRAILLFRNTLKFDEDDLAAYQHMARANRTLGDIPTAYASFLRVVEQVPAMSKAALRSVKWPLHKAVGKNSTATVR